MVEQWADLTNLLARVDGTEEFFEAADLAEELRGTGFTPETDTWAVWDGERLIAYGQVRVGDTLDEQGRARVSHDGGVHPDWRGRGLGRDLVARATARGVELAGQRHPGAPHFFRSGGELEGSDARRLLTHLGYTVARYFNELERPLPGADLAPSDVDGFTFVTPNDEHEEGVRLAHNAAFADHWGSAPSTPERWHDLWSSRSQRLPFSTLALGENGDVAAYVMTSQWTPRELYVSIVGTVAGARGRGLAAACMARSLGLAAASGEFDTVNLEVDSDSPTGATRLYERLGFTLARTFASMERIPSS